MRFFKIVKKVQSILSGSKKYSLKFLFEANDDKSGSTLCVSFSEVISSNNKLFFFEQ
jgi:hypothetical protein